MYITGSEMFAHARAGPGDRAGLRPVHVPRQVLPLPRQAQAHNPPAQRTSM